MRAKNAETFIGMIEQFSAHERNVFEQNVIAVVLKEGLGEGVNLGEFSEKILISDDY